MAAPTLRILEEFNVIEPPVPVFDIAKSLGVQIFETSAQVPWLARSRFDHDNARITVHRSDEPPQRRWAAAYELGRILKSPPDLYEDHHLSGGAPERFAVLLLMPRNDVWLYASMYRDTRLMISGMAESFGVPVMRIRYRLQDLKILV